MLSDLKIGEKVRIVEGVGKHADKKGLIAEYEGDLPFCVVFRRFGEWKEFDYEKFVAAGYDKRCLNSQAARITHPEWFGEDCSISDDAIFWFEENNPRFILPDGSKMWGAECWWECYEDNKDMETSEQELEVTKTIIRAVLSTPP